MPNLTTRSSKTATNTLLASRSAPLSFDASGKPKSLDEKTRSVEFVAATEQPVMVMDWTRWEVVPEVLLMSGCRLPPSGRCPFLNSHSYSSVSDIIGSFRDFKIVKVGGESQLVGRAYYSATPDGETPYQKTIEGHVTDVSVGYAINAYVWVEEGKTVEVEGRSFTGPVRVVTDWAVREESLCPIGADDQAKVRNQPTLTAGQTKKEQAMPAKKTASSGKRNKTAKSELELLKQRAATAKAEARAASLQLQAARAEAGVEDPELDEEGNPIEVTDTDTDDETRADTDVEDTDTEDTDAEDTDADTDAEPAKDGKRSAPRSPALAERARITGIRSICASFDVDAQTEEKLIKRGTSLNSARKEIMDIMSQRASNSNGYRISMGATEGEKFRSAAIDGLNMRCGLAVEKPAAGSDNLRGFSLRELARECLVRSGKSTSGDVREWVGRALATTDLPLILAEPTKRTLMESFKTAPETWREWCEIGTVSDFKTNRAVGVDADMSLKELGQGGEYENGRLSETPEEYKISSYGRKISVTREAIINDDLNALAVIPRQCGEAAAKLIGDIAVAALESNSTMGDGKALFHTYHNNLFVNNGGVPTIASLDKVKIAMLAQKDLSGNLLSIRPEKFLAPVALESSAEAFFQTQQGGIFVTSTAAEPIKFNPYGGNILKRIYEPRLDINSPQNWYLLSRMSVMMFFLNGMQEPFFEQYLEPGVDGVSWRVRHDAGAKALRWQTVAKSTK